MNKKELVILIAAQTLKHFEGLRNRPYNDSLNHCTVGYGHLLHKGPCTEKEVATVYTQSQIDVFLEQDVETAYKDAVNWLGEKEFEGLSLAWQVAVVSMSFQLGSRTLSLFVNTREAILAKDIVKLRFNLTRSKWNTQTPKRVKFVLALFEN